MKKHKYPGLFIAFEGLDGSGSSTQVDLLTDRLKDIGLFVCATKEPTNNLIGGLIRAALTKSWKPSSECFQLLCTADRTHHLQREILPLLEKGSVVISDRYLFSTIAFGSLDLDKNWLFDINKNFILPDATFFIRVLPKICIKRIAKDRDQLELFEEEQKLKKVLKTYDDLAKNDLGIITINGERSIRQIEEEIFQFVSKIIRGRGKKLRSREQNLINFSN